MSLGGPNRSPGEPANLPKTRQRKLRQNSNSNVAMNSPLLPAAFSSSSLNRDTDSISSNGRRTLKEGSVEMTSLSTALTVHRYFILNEDSLLIYKLKGMSSFKVKAKLRLSNLWVADANNNLSFIIGWPLDNFIVGFRNEQDKSDWYELLSFHVQKCLRPVQTVISMDINIRGRKQVIRRRVENGKKSGQLIVETSSDLGLPASSSYELKLSIGESSKTLHGPENVYAVIMYEIDRNGIRLSESQRQSLDTCAIASVRLTLSNMKSSKTPTPMQLVNSIKKKVLQRSDSRGVLGRELDGAIPPQPIMTIVDHLRMNGYEVEGIFRKPPKQSTFKELKQELEKGLVPDYNKYQTHVLASMLKEYLRSIPGKILQSGNYEMWMNEVVDEPDQDKKMSSARNLLSLLPSSHSILLANVLKLLHKVAQTPSSKMTSSALSVCLGPSFIESIDVLEGGKKVPLLVEFLIDNAASLIPGFSADNIFSIIHQVDHNSNVLCSPTPTTSEDGSSQCTPIIEELHDDDVLSLGSSEEKPDTCPDVPPPVPPLHDGPLIFSSDEEDEVDPRQLSRERFLSETLRSLGKKESKEKEVKMREKKEEKQPPAAPAAAASRVEDRKDTPRSPCLKRIHFQRAEAQMKRESKDNLFKFDNRTDFHFDKRRSMFELQDDLPDLRRGLREEATQTPDCGLPALASAPTTPTSTRFPSFPTKNSGDFSQFSGHDFIHSTTSSTTSTLRDTHTVTQRDTVILKDPPKTRQDEKPTVEVHPFSQEPSLQSISERLAKLRSRNKEELPESPRILRKALTAQPSIPSHPVAAIAATVIQSTVTQAAVTPSTVTSESYKESPRFTRRAYQPTINEEYAPSYAPPTPNYAPPTPAMSPPSTRHLPARHEPVESPKSYEVLSKTVERPRLEDNRGGQPEQPVVITERFSPYCSDYAPANKRNDLNRSSSQRGEKGAPRELQRASSVKSRGSRPDGCVGMEPMEINWSVRHLKTIFQDSKAPAIDTQYNYPY